jgi:YidC/Oxa1 family membrane protein insertase
MQNEDTRNTIIFVVCAALLLVVYQVFVIGPQAAKQKAAAAKNPPAAASVQAPGAPAAPQVPAAVTRAAAIAAGPRVPIETPSLRGSLSLKGGRIDDLYLIQYRQTVARNSPPVELLTPEGTEHPFFAEMGWVGANIPGLPNAQTVWTLAQGSRLAPGQPIVLTYTNGAGLTFTRQVAVDDKFMFTVTDTVANGSGQPVTLAPYGSVQRQGVPAKVLKEGVSVHQGGIAWLGQLRLLGYRKWQKDVDVQSFTDTGGWIGITDKYWLTALAPGAQERITGQFRKTPRGAGEPVLDANFVGQARTIGAGQQVAVTNHLFAGAKRAPVLKAYQDTLGVPHLDSAVDWGRLWFLTRPFFSFLSFIYQQVGNMGLAILVLTVVVRLVFFPIANKQYESMTKMKKVQPMMEELRKKHKDDPAKQQQELMALYQREKVNPLAGCLPILLQIPVFFALFKVLTVTIEMRHAPFVGYIRDLSAPDPTTIWNLFGLIPWDPSLAPMVGGLLAGPLHIGVLPILYGLTMWLTTAMSPPAPDPAQQAVFRLMPLIFTFIMAQFAIGLLVYYTWSNLLTALQQYVIMRRFGVESPIDKLFARFGGKPRPAE